MSTIKPKRKKTMEGGGEKVISRYMSPFTDFGFKKLFGEEANKELLMDFLNELLPIEEKIQDLTFQNNEQLGMFQRDRNAIFDIFCKDQKGREFIVEMQNGYQVFYKDRAVFYSTFPLQQQGVKGAWNFELKPVYCVGLLGFNLFGDPDPHEEIYHQCVHKVSLKDDNNRVFYDKLTYVFIELKKFTKEENALNSRFDKWIYFLKNLANFEEIPAIFNEPVFKQAVDVARLANYSDEERWAYEYSLKAFRDNVNVISTALSDGLKKGLEQGIEQGIEQGKLEVARNMKLQGMDSESITQYTGLPIEIVNTL